MLEGVGKIPTAYVVQRSSLVSANKSSAVLAARQTEQGKQKNDLVPCLAAGGDEQNVKTILLTSPSLVLNETK